MLIESVETYRRAYGHYPKRVLADTIFRTRENLRYCKEHGIHMNGPRLGRRRVDDAAYRQEHRQEWLESGERGEIEREFGVSKRRYSLGHITTKLKHTSEAAVCAIVLTMSLWRKLRLLFCTILLGWRDAFLTMDRALISKLYSGLLETCTVDKKLRGVQETLGILCIYYCILHLHFSKINIVENIFRLT